MSDLNKTDLREFFAEVISEEALKNEKILIVCADSINNLRLKEFAIKYPERIFDVGIAEQSLVGVSAGMATFGLIPFAGTMSCFISMRACEQVRTSVAYPRLNVKLVGIHSGVSMGPGGTTHHATEDMAIIRSMANMTLLVPADGIETVKIIREAIRFEGPCYIRLAGGKAAPVYDTPESCMFKIGKSITVREGRDITIIAAGPPCVYESILTADELAKEGISVRVIDMASVKPVDMDAIVKAAGETGSIITVEDHNIIGGLGSAVAEVIVETKPVPVKRIGIPDIYSAIGPSDLLWKRYGLTHHTLGDTVREALKNK
jgi:transketolase